MRSIMAAKTPQDTSFSFSRRYFHWKKKVEDDDDEGETLNFRSSSLGCVVTEEDRNLDDDLSLPVPQAAPRRKKRGLMSVSKLRSALTFGKTKLSPGSGLGKGTRVVGTLFGYRRGHVHIAFQEDPKLGPAFLVELATPTSFLVREMASGLVRIALECDKKSLKKSFKLLEEPLWRTYCNGKKCGYAMRRDCGPDEWKVFNSVGPITMGAGVLPEGGGGSGGGGGEGELMYMRARFERIVGSKDSEAFYMMNPDSNGGPELSIYLIRV
ncbi:protein MIZU-KUSSEI 1 [Lactuca sativa]|uniref:protein MIZU-KUSSEI 1 n=1 Tax=Lactuca sativa TaxID=4236 RepID=UPI000CC049C8|nr:protein MIZU-KUSSEI 1 [Lactuca sativa]